MEEGAVPAFVAEAVRVICENGKEITWDDVMAFGNFNTVPDALSFVKEKRMDVFSYYKTEQRCVTVLSRLLDFYHLRPCIMVPVLEHLVEDAKHAGVLEKCAQSPCWVSMQYPMMVSKPIAVLVQSGALVHFVPYLTILYDYDGWCQRSEHLRYSVFVLMRYVGISTAYFPALLDSVRPPVSIFTSYRKEHQLAPCRKVLDAYAAAGDACRAMAWACRSENAGGVWYDLWVCVAERWDYRADSWADAEVSEKRLKK
jgi:hypothetical protein